MDRLLSPQQVAEACSVSVRTVHRLKDHGVLPYVKLGVFVRFKESDIEKWIEENRGGIKRVVC